MMKILNLMGNLLAISIALLGLYLWYSDGAWEQGALSTKGLYKVLIFAGISSLSFGILRGLQKK